MPLCHAPPPRRARILPALALACLMAQGCASPLQNYPSIGLRRAERIAGNLAAPPAPPPVVAAGPAAPLAGDPLAPARAAHQAFLAHARAEAGRLGAARGAPAGSDAWADGELALARLATHRSNTAAVLADLDAKVAEEQRAGLRSPALEAARSEVAQWVAEQDRLLETLAPVAAGETLAPQP